jgi:predicted metal-dependent peptidase
MDDTFAEKLYDHIDSHGDGGRGGLVSSHDFWKEMEKAYNKGQGGPSRLQAEWKSIMTRAQGRMPAGVSLGMEYSQRVRVPWYKELEIYLQDMIPYDYSPHRFRRVKSKGGSYYMPRLASPMLKLAVVYDTSGSISRQQMNRMLTEVWGIVRSFDNYELMIIACDAAVHGVWYLRPGDELPKAVGGGGGTDFRPAFKRVEEDDFQPDCLVFFTDTWGTFPNEEPPYPVVWGVVGVTDYDLPWGKALEIIVED